MTALVNGSVEDAGAVPVFGAVVVAGLVVGVVVAGVVVAGLVVGLRMDVSLSFAAPTTLPTASVTGFFDMRSLALSTRVVPLLPLRMDVSSASAPMAPAAPRNGLSPFWDVSAVAALMSAGALLVVGATVAAFVVVAAAFVVAPGGTTTEVKPPVTGAAVEPVGAMTAGGEPPMAGADAPPVAGAAAAGAVAVGAVGLAWYAGVKTLVNGPYALPRSSMMRAFFTISSPI